MQATNQKFRIQHTIIEYLVDDKPFQVLNLIPIGMQCRSWNGLIPFLYLGLSHRHRKMNSHARLHHFRMLDLQRTAEHIYFIHVANSSSLKEPQKIQNEFLITYLFQMMLLTPNALCGNLLSWALSVNLTTDSSTFHVRLKNSLNGVYTGSEMIEAKG